MIYDHTGEKYLARWNASSDSRWNGAYYYSIEIVENIIPAVNTTRSWVTVNVPGECEDGAIVFIHNNRHPEHYDWLKKYSGLVLVCGVPETKRKVSHLGKAIHLPLSINVAEVEQYRKEKKCGTAYVGRPSKRDGVGFPAGTDIIEGLPREQLLPTMALYQNIYAVGRTAIEAKVLGCRVLPYDPRFPHPNIWKVVDNLDAARILQKQLDKIDRRETT